MESILYRQASSSDSTVGVRGWLAYLTGLNLAFAVSYLWLKPPEAHTHDLARRVFISLSSVGLACLCGWLGTRTTMPYRSERHLPGFIQAGLRGWVFLPSIALFLKHESFLAQIVAGISAVLMADCIRRFVEWTGDPEFSWSYLGDERAMFATESLIGPRSVIPFYVSLCLFGTVATAAAGQPLLEMMLLSCAVFLLVFQANTMKAQILGRKDHLRSQVYSLILVGVCFTFFALSPFINSFGVPVTGWSMPHLPAGKGALKAHATVFHAIVLWPIKKEEKVIPTFVVKAATMSPGRARPWSIPFTGPYWYLKVMGEVPGNEARVVQDDPLIASVRSADRSPLIVEAHQRLAEPIDLACCREIQVVIRNDSSFGTTAVGLTLTNSQSKRSLSLGTKNVVAQSSVQPLTSLSTTEQTLSFPITQRRTIVSFDEIAVTLQSDEKRWTVGRKVAVERFTLIPN